MTKKQKLWAAKETESHANQVAIFVDKSNLSTKEKFFLKQQLQRMVELADYLAGIIDRDNQVST